MANVQLPDREESGAWRRWLSGLALAAIAALLITPATRWVLRDQLQGRLAGSWYGRDVAVAAQVAAARPDDYPLQLAAAIQWPGLSGANPRLEALLPRFAERP